MTRVSVLAGRYQVTPAVVFAELEEESVLLQLDSGIYFGLDVVGTEIWRRIEQGTSTNDIILQLLEDFDVDLEQLRADLSELLSQLEEHGLIVPGDS